MAAMKISDLQTVEMKTDISTGNVENVIWSSDVQSPQFAQNECVPMIGSSILSTLDEEKTLSSNLNVQNMDLIVLDSQSENFIFLKSDISTSTDEGGTNFAVHSEVTSEENCNELTYFLCEVCPFVCLSEKRLIIHVENSHYNNYIAKVTKIKCPACSNIFFHKLSFRSHLINDHLVSPSDLTKIMATLVKKNNVGKTVSTKTDEILRSKPNEMLTIHCKKEFDFEDIDKFTILSSEKILNGNEIQDSGLSQKVTNGTLLDTNKISQNKTNESPVTPVAINLPECDIIKSSSEKICSTIPEKQSISSKFLDKKINKCTFSLCKVRMETTENLNYHIKCHSDVTFKCPECDENFSFWKPLTGHLWRQHKIDMELYSCDKCDYKCYSLGKLNSIHKLIHNDSKPFLCDLCPRAFKNSKQLRNHKAIHKQKTDCNDCVCEICPKTFSDRRQLRVHTDSVHKKLKPYLCNYCGYKGATRNALRMHMRQHTGEKPFACDICAYTSSDHNSLRRHRLRHTGEMPYRCIHCDYGSIQSSTYKVHLRTKHPGLEQDLMYSCTECLFRTINKSMYDTHLATVHIKSAEET